jgi:adenylylsulfate kinase
MAISFRTKRILVMGLPGSGKTTFSQELVKRLMLNHKVAWFNADAVRKEYNDWDFSTEGRLRQVKRMRELADTSNADFAICDFVCPTDEYRKVFDADITVWMDTIESSRFGDTNKVFVPPLIANCTITDWNQCNYVIENIIATLTLRSNETYIRSFLKSISWRIWGTIDTFVISWFVTGTASLAFAISGLEVFTKLFWYWLHERLWLKIKVR